MKSYEIYVKTDCSFSKKAVELLISKELPFLMIVMDKYPSFMERLKANFNYQTVPIILLIEQENFDTEPMKQFIGGFSELEEHLKKEMNKYDGP